METTNFPVQTTNFPVQTLYFSCLNYLRINYKLINFTVLNDEIASDMSIIMRKYEYLKKFRMIPFRDIKLCNFASYIYKHYKNIMQEVVIDEYVKSLIKSKSFIEYIPGVMSINPLKYLIYEPSTNIVYSSYCDVYEYAYVISTSQLCKIYPDIKFKEYNDDKIALYSEEFFDQFPGMTDWMESMDYVSKKLWIPENLIE